MFWSVKAMVDSSIRYYRYCELLTGLESSAEFDAISTQGMEPILGIFEQSWLTLA